MYGISGNTYVDLCCSPLEYEWTIVWVALHAVAGRIAHINWYYYGPRRQYCSRVAHTTLVHRMSANENTVMSVNPGVQRNAHSK